MGFRACASGIVLVVAASAAHAQIVNGSFETGDFTGWVVNDVSVPLDPIGVEPAGTPVSFGIFLCPQQLTAPSDGLFCAHLGFAGAGPSVARIAQDVWLGPCDTRLEFDWRAGWEMGVLGTATLPRVFRVDVEPAGGGAFLQRSVLLVAAPDTDECGRAETGSVDLSPFVGQPIRISFEWEIPESFTGPGMFELDDVRIAAPFENGSFETGDFEGWIVQDPGFTGIQLFSGGPTQGFYGLLVHPQGSGGVGSFAQDVTLGPCATTLHFNWGGSWVETFGVAHQFRVDVEPAGGGNPLLRTPIVTINPGASGAGSDFDETIDVSAFAGTTVRISFEWVNAGTTPQSTSILFALDDVRIDCAPSTSAVRNGGGTNPAGFSEVAPAVIGRTWISRVALPSGAVGSSVTIGMGGPFAGFFLHGAIEGELLVLPPFTPAHVVPGTDHALAVPPNCAIVGTTFSAQAGVISLNPLRLQLQNAIDLTVGTQ